MKDLYPKKRVHVVDELYITVEEPDGRFGYANAIAKYYRFRLINKGLIIGEFELGMKKGIIEQIYPDSIDDNFGKVGYEVSNINRS